MAAAAARIWIVRKGNGQVVASPSPCPVSGSFFVFNATGAGTVHLTFPSHVDPPEADVTPARPVQFDVGTVASPLYLEYHAVLDTPAGSLYVEGGSKPGIIIDA